MYILDGPFMHEIDKNNVDDITNPLDPPPYDPTTRNRPLWLCDTLQDDGRHVLV